MDAPGVGYYILFVLLFAAGLAAILVPQFYRMSPGSQRDSMRGALTSSGGLTKKAKIAWGIVGGFVCAMSLVAIIVGATR